MAMFDLLKVAGLTFVVTFGFMKVAVLLIGNPVVDVNLVYGCWLGIGRGV